MSTITTSDLTDAPDAPAARRSPGAPIETHAELPAILAAIKRGDPMRDIASRYDISTSSVHRLATKLREQMAERTGEPPPPQPRAEPVDLPAALEASCQVCALDPVARSHIDRALFGSPAPDLQRIAAAFKVPVDTLRKHWAHTARPRELDPEPPPRAPTWKPTQPPHPLPPDAAAAEALIDAAGINAARRIAEWARLEFLAFSAKWPGPDGYKTEAWRNYERVAKLHKPVDTLLAATALIHRLVELANTDAMVLKQREDEARMLAHARPVNTFSAQSFLAILGQRGCTAKLDSEGKIVISNPASLNSLDREILARHRNEIADTLAVTERF